MLIEKVINVLNIDDVITICGAYDKNIELLQRQYNVVILVRGNDISVSGEENNVKNAVFAVEALMKMIDAGETINEQVMSYVYTLVLDGEAEKITEIGANGICVTVSGKTVKPKTIGQRRYAESLDKNTILIGIGPAGTGKTYLAVAMAARAYKNHEVNRIILTRPAVEAGEKLGFLPGDMQNKVDPYLRPLYDALYEMFGAETFQRLMEKGTIEVAPLAFMRGRTLDDAFIILDEAQNTTREQLKMFLTRLGFNSKMVINGDITQIDLPDSKRSGLVDAIRVLRGVEGITIQKLTDKDVIRHKLVGDIIKAYDSARKKD
ncbi:MAG: PhoH family protein [Ruminococcus sp.]|jgi:phosphate starvation-inducible PhoH-like protein|nr:PhoH family protein [Ruminococcus sp.]